MNRYGVEAPFDAIVFLTVLGVASCIIFASSAAWNDSDQQRRRSAATSYARESLNAILSSTLDDAYYIGGNGTRVNLERGLAVESFVLEETFLLAHGWNVSSFDGCNSRVAELARTLITRAYMFSLESWLRDIGAPESPLILGDHRAGPGYSASSDYFVHGESAKIVLTIWWS